MDGEISLIKPSISSLSDFIRFLTFENWYLLLEKIIVPKEALSIINGTI
jgi:hypothetical protein